MIRWLPILLVASSAHAVVFTDDPATHLVTPDSPFAMVGQIDGGCAVLVAPEYIVTAAHVAHGDVFLLWGESYGISNTWFHPLYDLAVLRLDRSTGLAGYDLYRGSDELGQKIVVVGYGVSGVNYPQPELYPKGACRVGTNTIGDLWGAGFAFNFQLGEGSPAAGDSGAASFLFFGRPTPAIVGIHRTICDGDADGICPELGDWAIDVRISAAADWIDSIIMPEPVTLALLTIGAVGLLIRRRKS